MESFARAAALTLSADQLARLDTRQRVVIEAGACRVPVFCLAAFCCARFLTFSPNHCGESLSPKNETFSRRQSQADYDKIMV